MQNVPHHALFWFGGGLKSLRVSTSMPKIHIFTYMLGSKPPRAIYNVYTNLTHFGYLCLLGHTSYPAAVALFSDLCCMVTRTDVVAIRGFIYKAGPMAFCLKYTNLTCR
jgi:hypothetical protein